jgi:D-alanine-D-alanine ligase
MRRLELEGAKPAMQNRRIGVLMGGLSSERDVSIQTGQAVLAALQDRGYDAQALFVDRDIDLALRQRRIDTAFIALHGRYGEDGCIQGLLETLGIPYTGSDVLASALAMNKAKAKQMFRICNLPTPPYYLLERERDLDPVRAHGDFGFPAVVKPVSEGSSVGVEIVNDQEELVAACERAFCFDSELLVERFVDGREISVAILGERAIGAVEIVPRHGFYDYASKYTRGESDYFIPPRISPERYRGVLTQALAAHQTLGCSGVSRVDMIVNERGNEFILEVNTLPGLTRQSLLPKIADAAGLGFEDLVEAILQGARLSCVDRVGRDRRIAQRPFPGDERREAGVPEHH